MANWHVLYDQVVPYIVRIETPEGFGSGFLFAYNKDRTVAGFATAAHVIQHADAWKLPIKIIHHASGKTLYLNDGRRFIDLDIKRDSAGILTPEVGDYLPKTAPRMLDPARLKKVGVEVAWAGYPVIASPHLCLFTGTVAAHIAYDDSYLIDGVAINGVSGGPVFSESDDDADEVSVIGTISSYMPNQQSDATLPGMLRAHDITAFANIVTTMKNIDGAREAKEREEAAKRQAEAAGTSPPTDATAVSVPPTEPQLTPAHKTGAR